MIQNYDNELNPSRRDEAIEDGGMCSEDSRTLEALKEEYYSLLSRLEELRGREPAKKHNNRSKFEHMCWVENTHDMRDQLNEIAEKIRQLTNGGIDESEI